MSNKRRSQTFKNHNLILIEQLYLPFDYRGIVTQFLISNKGPLHNAGLSRRDLNVSRVWGGDHIRRYPAVH